MTNLHVKLLSYLSVQGCLVTFCMYVSDLGFFIFPPVCVHEDVPS